MTTYYQYMGVDVTKEQYEQFMEYEKGRTKRFDDDFERCDVSLGADYVDPLEERVAAIEKWIVDFESTIK